MAEDLTQDKVKPEKERFFFTKNIFDEGYVDEDAEPPEPTFSEDELKAAKDQAFQQGKQEGTQQTSQKEQQSREQHVAQAMQVIAKNSNQLFQQELQREERFEQEAVALSMRIFETLFPIYQKEHGFDELKHHIESVLQKHKKTPSIDVYVAEENKDGIDAFLADLVAKGHSGEFHVHVDPNLSDTACRLDWEQGGSYFDRDTLAQEIGHIMQQMLAGEDTTSHDKKEDDVLVEQDSQEPVEEPAENAEAPPPPEPSEDNKPDDGEI